MNKTALLATVDDMVELVNRIRALPEGLDDGALSNMLAIIKAAWNPLSKRASVLADSIADDFDAMSEVKQYTERVLTPLFMGAPMPERAYRKPQGYPGDYRIMLYYYDAAFEGATTGDKLLHRLFVDHPLSAGVVARRDHVVDRIARRFDGRPLRVLSLGCGPAREVVGLFERMGTVPVEFTLVDQDNDAIDEALSMARCCGIPAYGVRRSVGAILRDPKSLGDLGKFDIVFSTGLFDYLKHSTATNLLRALGDLLAPGGELIVANAARASARFFEPEFVLDWSLVYRTRSEMEALATEAFVEESVPIYLEPTGAYWFLRYNR